MANADYITFEPVVQVKDTWAAETWLTVNVRPLTTTLAELPNLSSAVFSHSYGSIAQPGVPTFTDETKAVNFAGYFIRMIHPDDESVLWIGIITERADSPAGPGAADNNRQIGDEMIYAVGLERLLDVQVAGSRMWDGSAARDVDVRYPFNLRHANGLSVLGNRSTAVHAGSYLFSDQAATWTARQAVEYLLAVYGPTSPAITLSANAAAANLAELVDVWEMPANGNLLQALARLIDRRRGHTARVTYDAATDTVLLVVRSLFDQDVVVGSTTIAANDAQLALDLDAAGQLAEEPVIRYSDLNRYDKIIAQGGRLLVCGTVRLTPAWSSSAETAYEGADDEGRAGNYDRHGDVYTAFTVTDAATAPFELDEEASVPGLGIPSCNADGTIDWETESCILTRGAPLHRQTPLRRGWDYTASPPVQSDAAAPEEFVPPSLYVTHLVNNYRRIYNGSGLTRHGTSNIGVSVLDGQPGLRLHVPYNHYVALNRFDGESRFPARFDYETIRATVAIAADVRLRVEKTIRGGPRTLLIAVPGAECWLMREGTILGVTQASGSNHSTYVRATADVELRNDKDLLEAVAGMAAAWYGRQRAAAVLAWRAVWYAMEPGAMITTVTRNRRQHTVNTTITHVRHDWVSHATEVSTDFAEIDFAAMAGTWRRTRSGPRLGSPAPASAGLDAPSLAIDRMRPANLPVRPMGGVHEPATRWGVVIDGTEMTPPNKIYHGGSPGDPSPAAWDGYWFEEIDPLTLEIIAPSASRDKNNAPLNAWVKAWADGANSSWWPLKVGSYFQFVYEPGSDGLAGKIISDHHVYNVFAVHCELTNGTEENIEGGMVGVVGSGEMPTVYDCGFKYTVRGIDGTVLAVDASPVKARLPGTKYVKPTGSQNMGTAVIIAGTLHLLEVLAERPETAVVFPVKSVQVSGLKLQMMKTAYRVLDETQGDQVWVDVHEGTECPEPGA